MRLSWRYGTLESMKDTSIIVETTEQVALPAQLRGYLLKSGWVFSREEFGYSIFSKTLEGQDVEIECVLNDRFGDYDRHFHDILVSLKIIEKRSTLDILRDIKRESIPYIGVTDFTSSEQILSLAKLFREKGLQLQAGVMMSYKTLNNIPTQWKDVWPDKSAIKDIFIRNPYVLNTLHYADYDGVDVLRNLIEATKYCGPNLDAIQLDMIWPTVTDIRAYRAAFPDIKIILQVGSKAFEMVENCLVQALSGYPIDYVLLDMSGGRGIQINVDGLRPAIEAIRAALPEMKIAVAGGLGPHNVLELKDLVTAYPQISLDAQSKVRPSGSSKDPVDWGMAGDYVEKALSLYSL